MVPVFLDPTDIKVIVFGGGKVALRKCRYFEGANITVVASEVLPEVRALAHQVLEQRIPDNVCDMIDRFEIVIAATDDKELNNRIRDDAKFIGIKVNSAHGGGTLLIPSVLKRDGYQVAVSSIGRIPAFPPYMVSILDGLLDERYDLTLDFLMELRPMVMEQIRIQNDRRLCLESILANEEILDLVQSGKSSEAMSKAKELGGIR
jgi:siroheme synthase-like protein